MNRPRKFKALPYKKIWCFCCGWHIAAQTLHQLFTEGWRICAAFRGNTKTGMRIEMRWFCRTCSDSYARRGCMCDPRACPEEERSFAEGPDAPPYCFPRIGGGIKSDRQRNRVKPYCGKCRGGDPSLDDDVVHAHVETWTPERFGHLCGCGVEYHNDLSKCPMCGTPKGEEVLQ